MLDKLWSFLCEMYSDDTDLSALFELVLRGNSLYPSQMMGGMLSHNTCSTSQSTGAKLVEIFLVKG